MKNTLAFGLLIVLFSSSLHAQRVTFGPAVSGIYSWANVNTNNNSASVQGIGSYAAGLFVRVKIGKFYLQPEAFYARKGANISMPDSATQKLRYNSFDVNLMLGLQLFKFAHDDAGIRIHTGPGMNSFVANSFMINDKSINASNFNVNAFNWQFGLGVDIMNRFFLDFRYVIGASDISKMVNYKIVPNMATVQLCYKLIKDR